MIRKGNKIYFSQNAFWVLNLQIQKRQNIELLFKKNWLQKMQNNLIEHLDIFKRDL